MHIIRDGKVVQWIKEASQAIAKWRDEDPILHTKVLHEAGFSDERINHIFKQEPVFQQGDAERYAHLYWIIGNEAVNPTKIPDEIQPTRSTTASPVTIKRAINETFLLEIGEKIEESKISDSLTEDMSQSVKSELAEEPVQLNEIYGKREKQTWAIAVSQAISQKANELGIKRNSIAKKLGIPKSTWNHIRGGWYILKDPTWYAKLFYEYGIQEADPRKIPPLKRNGSRYIKRAWSEDEYKNWVSRQTPLPTSEFILESVIEESEPSEKIEMKEEEEKEETLGQATKLSEEKNPWIVAAATSLKAWCRKNDYYPSSTLAEELGIKLERWSRINNGRSFTDPEIYAKLYLRTGLPELDPRTIPSKRVITPSVKSEKVRAWSQGQWIDWFNRQSEEARQRFIRLSEPVDPNNPEPSEADKSVEETQPTPPPTTIGGLVDSLVTTVSQNIARLVVESIRQDQILSQNIARLVVESIRQDQGLVENLATKPENHPASHEASANSVIERLAEFLLASLPVMSPEKVDQELAEAIAPTPNVLTFVQRNTMAEALKILIEIFDRNVINATSQHRDRILEANRDLLGELSRRLRPALQGREARDEAIEMFKQVKTLGGK